MTAKTVGRGVIKDIVIVVVGVLVIWIGLQVIFGTQNPFYVVSSGSMIPKLNVYDVLVVQGNEPFEEVKVGDVIVFNRPSGHDRVIVHRVVSIIDDDPYTIRTKGDANPASIPGTDYPITQEEYIGQVAYVIPQVGYITRILTPPINYIIIAIIIGIMVFKQISKKKKEKELSFTDPFEPNDVKSFNPEPPAEKLDNLDKIPKDSAYSAPKEKKIDNIVRADEPKNIDNKSPESENLDSKTEEKKD